MSLPIFPDQVQTDPATAPKPRRNRASAKAAGRGFERLVANFLRDALGDDRIDRRVKTGAKDLGDIAGVRTIRGGRVVIECKDVARPDLPGWLRQPRRSARTTKPSSAWSSTRSAGRRLPVSST